MYFAFLNLFMYHKKLFSEMIFKFPSMSKFYDFIIIVYAQIFITKLIADCFCGPGMMAYAPFTCLVFHNQYLLKTNVGWSAEKCALLLQSVLRRWREYTYTHLHEIFLEV